MDFARKQLEKYGWEEGKGLGKNEDGISVAIKPKLKFDTSGIGHKESDECHNNWWQTLYNKAANNVDVVNADGKIHIKVKSEHLKITNKSYLQQNVNIEYGNFLKTSKLTEEGIINFKNNNDVSETKNLPEINILNDDELFAACGGRTAHKGARHGLKLNGKLSRIEKQEKMLLKKLKKVTLVDSSNGDVKKYTEKKLKKISEHKNDFIEEEDTLKLSVANLPDLSNSPSSSSAFKKKKKERRRVSFHETVTEYHSHEHDPDSSSHSEGSCNSPSTVLIRKSKIKGMDNETRLGSKESHKPSGSSLDNKSNFESLLNEEPQSRFQTLSKKERKILKRKLQNMHKTCTQTNRFLQTLSPLSISASKSVDAEKLVSVKRKLNLDIEDFNPDPIKKQNRTLTFFHDYNKTEQKLFRKQQKIGKRIDKVADSFNNICKIAE